MLTNFAAPCDFSDEDMSVIDGELSSTSSGGGGKKGTSGLMSGGAGGNGGVGLSKKANDRKSARARTVLSEKQLNILKTCYSANPRPDALMKEQLVEMTGLSPRVVRVWFQNKRCKDKKIQNRLMEKQMQRETVRTFHTIQHSVSRFKSALNHRPLYGIMRHWMESQKIHFRPYFQRFTQIKAIFFSNLSQKKH